MATGDQVYANNHRVFALGQDQQTASTTWWADFWNLTSGSGAKFFLRDEGQDYTGAGPAPSVNPFVLNKTYTIAVYEGDIAAVTGAVYQRTFNVNSVSNNWVPGGSGNSSVLALVDNVAPGLGEDDPSNSVNTARLDVAVPLPVASQYTIVAVPVN